MSELYKRLAELSPEKRALLVKKVRQKKAAAPPAARPERASSPLIPAVTRRGADQTFPQSFSQERFWFHQQWAPRSSAYNDHKTYRVDGRVDEGLLHAAVDAVFRRHEVLRARFGQSEGRSIQTIPPFSPPYLRIVDLTGLPPAPRQSAARRLSAEEARRPFDLSRGPTLRIVLVQLEEERHALVFTLHHIVTDGRSWTILIRELTALYDAFSQGLPSPLPDPPFQYVDYAAWQRERIQDGWLEGELAYWKENLRGIPALLELPTDRPRSGAQSLRGALERFGLGEELSARLVAGGRRAAATPFMVLLAVFQTLLHRYSGQRDVVVGSPVEGRHHVGTEALIGVFINTLVLRGRVSGEASFDDLLAEVRRTAAEAFAHQDVPFEMLVEALQPERTLSHAPLFQVLFGFQEARAEAVASAGLRLRPLRVDTGTTRADLSLTMSLDGTECRGNLGYSTDLFDRSTVVRMLGAFKRLVEDCLRRPAARLGDLAVASEAERHALLGEWNDTDTLDGAGVPAHRMLEAQVERRPHALAVTAGGRALTYGELGRRSGWLALRLRAGGLEPDTVAGILIERSPEMVVAAAGVLRSGGAYLALDPALPERRLAFMLEDSRAAFLVTDRTVGDGLLGRSGVRVVGVPAASAERPQEDRESRAEGGNLAYVIYTSGSTGRPKGVAVHHAGLANLIAWHCRTYPPSWLARSSQLAGLSFDASVWEVWPPLATGATLHIADDATRVSAPDLLEWMARSRVTQAFVPTPVAELMLHHRASPAGLALGGLLTGGDRLHHGAPRHAPYALVNHYGPTESSVVATAGVVPPGAGGAAPPIGRPISNVEAHVADRRLRAAPLGAAGELTLGGRGLARGYLNAAALTAERFVPHPWSRGPGARLYRTGDRARFLQDGRIDFQGRFDHQVKIRGLRIELGEIESALAAHPEVREAIVSVREDRPGEKRLAAYLVPGSAPPDPDALRRHLEARLPEYMVPSLVFVLDALPLTANGKVDREALRSLPHSEGSPLGTGAEPASAGEVAPRDDTELRLLGIFKEILGARQIGISDSFFRLGGHSLLAVRVAARIEEEFDRKLPLSAFFENPTVGGLASVLRRRGSEERPPRSLLVKLQPGTSGAPLFCVHPVGGHVFCYVELAQAIGPDQAVYGLQAPDPGPATDEAPDLEELAARYGESVREAQPEGPISLAGWSMGAVVAFEMARQLHEAGRELALVAMLDPPPPHRKAAGEDLERGALLAAFAKDLTGRDLPRPVDELRRLGRDEQWSYLLELAVSAGALPAETSADFLMESF